MSQNDMRVHGFKEKELVDLYNDHSGIQRRANGFYVIPYSIPDGCVATYFPEANVLVPIKSKAKKSNTPASKSVVISVKASEQV